MKLVDEADLGTPDTCALGIGQRTALDTVDVDFAAVGPLEQSGNVQER